MKKPFIMLVGGVLILYMLLTCSLFYLTFSDEKSMRERYIDYITPSTTCKKPEQPSDDNINITLAVVACGDRFEETVVMLKSALLLTKSPLRFIIFADDDLYNNFPKIISPWKKYKSDLSFEIRRITFPGNSKIDWKTLFKPCAAQRLFLPSLLPKVDSLLYVDTDVLFLTPLESIWSFFHSMNSSQMAALAPEHEDRQIGWYNRFARHPYYGELGVNSGVMLMNLTRMREFPWIDYLPDIYNQYRYNITWGDQDIINIIFHFHPDKLFVYPCRWNYRPDHCMYMSVCKSAETFGVAVLHGNRRTFHNDKEPVFKIMYDAFKEFDLISDSIKILLLNMKNGLMKFTGTHCGKIWKVFVKNFSRYI